MTCIALDDVMLIVNLLVFFQVHLLRTCYCLLLVANEEIENYRTFTGNRFGTKALGKLK